jgi:5-methylcytosine-specific restriction endonuclease McrA
MVEAMADEVLVLNENYEPLNVTNAKRAIALLYLGKAVEVERDSRVFHSERLTVHLPSVIRLARFVKRPLPQLKLSRRSILARDDYICQYCGEPRRDLTVDHVIPRHRHGPHTWENLVCCCMRCNNKKGNRTPQEAGMRLRRPPRRPRFVPYISLSRFTAALRKEAWLPYLEPFAGGLDMAAAERSQ